MREQCLDDCSRYFVARGNSRPLAGPELRAIAKDKKLAAVLIAGWETHLLEGDPPVVVRVLIDHHFPYSAPTLVLQGEIMFCTWPHVESQNQLCVVSQIDRRAIIGGSGMIEALLTRAGDVVQQGKAGTNVGEFSDELHSYWTTGTPGLALNLPNPDQPCLLDVRMHRGCTTAVDVRIADAWYKRFGVADAQPWRAGCYIPLAEPLMPPDFPKTIGDFRRLLSRRQIDDPIRLVKHGEITSIFYVLGVPTASELAGTSRTYLGLRMEAPTAPISVEVKHQFSRTYRRNLKFRPEKLKPPHDLRRSFPDSDTAQRIAVHRCDGAWIHARGGVGNQPQLATKHVLVIGCGSLGSPVAVLLAKAGVGRLTLLDYDILTWDNPGRHELGGADAIGKRKNFALAQELQGRFPHLAVDGQFASRWEEHYRAHPEVWKSADLIITTTADWPSDFALSVAHRHDGVIACPLLFGFVEAHAAAGQVIRIDRTGSCYRCGTNDFGHIQRTVFNWDKSQLVKEQSCGAFFQPYGAADLAPSAAMIAKSGIDYLLGRPATHQRTVRISDTEQVLTLGATLNPTSGVPTDDAMAGSREVRCAWPSLPGCPVCGG